MEYFYKKCDKDNENLVEMKNRLLTNISVINDMKSELKRLKFKNNKRYNNDTTNNKEIIELDSDFDLLCDNDEVNFFDEVNYYYEEIKGVNIENDDDFQSLELLLPSRANYKYKDIILGICLLLLKEINEIKEFIEKEKNDIFVEDLNGFKDEIISIQNKIDIIKKVSTKNDSEDIDLSSFNLNNIVFLETSSGNVYALEDIKAIDGEYYVGFTELIKSIENGTFKNVKYLTSGNNKTARISEVKGFKRRVIFDRVGFNTYVIIGVFIKKSDKDKSYIEPLKNRIAIYRKNRDRIVELVKDAEYLNNQKEILNSVHEFLEINKRGGNSDEFLLCGRVNHGKTRRVERTIKSS